MAWHWDGGLHRRMRGKEVGPFCGGGVRGGHNPPMVEPQVWAGNDIENFAPI